MKKYFAIISTALLLGSCADKPQQSQGDGEEARFVDSVVARMDLKQKIGQLVQSSVVRPVLELKDFRRVEIPAGQTVDVTFDLPVSRLEFFGLDNQFVLEPGKFKIWIAQDSNLKGAVEGKIEVR